MNKIKKAVIAGALAIGIAASGTAMANAGGSYYLHAGRDYSSASTSTNGGTQGMSFARHGGLSVWSPWTTRSSSARADVGTSYSYAAAAYFK